MNSIKIYFLISLFLLFASCVGKTKNVQAETPVITVTIEPQRYFAEAIAGDKFKVVSMVPKGVSPETYDPAPKQLVNLEKSTAYFRIGHIGFEQIWMKRITGNLPHLLVFDLSKGVQLIDDAGHTHGDIHSVADPHIWSSTVNAKLIAANIFQVLCELDKENKSYYLSRYDSLVQRINHTDSLIRSCLKGPDADHSFLIYHPALSYFARDYGLHQICIESNGKEPSSVQLKLLINRCRKEGVHVIFVQPEFDRRNAEVISKETGAVIVPINPLSYDWEKEMLNIARSLTRH
jgi:zinc transport system substrate-binding protein